MNNYDQRSFNKLTFNSKDDYRRLLSAIKTNIGYVLLFHSFDMEDEVIMFAKKNMKLINEKSSNKFCTSKYSRKMPIYTFEFNQEFYKYLQSFDYIFINTDENNVQFNENFTQVDMAFLDKEMNLIFHMITHEGLAYLNKDFEQNLGNIK